MNDAFRVCGRQTICDLCRVLRRTACRERPGLKFLPQRLAFQQFGYEIAGRAVHSDVEDAQDVGVVESSDGACLLLESQQTVGIFGERTRAGL